MAMGPGGGPSPRATVRDGWWAALAVALLVGLAAVGFFVHPLFPSLCAGCPGETPLGTVLQMEPGVGACPSENGSAPTECGYTFPLHIEPNSPTTLTEGNLGFELENASGGPIGFPFTVTLVASSGCGPGAWTTSTSGSGPRERAGTLRNRILRVGPDRLGRGARARSQLGGKPPVLGVGRPARRGRQRAELRRNHGRADRMTPPGRPGGLGAPDGNAWPVPPCLRRRAEKVPVS